MSNTTQRDAFWNRLYEIARRDRDVILVSADMGAPSLDKFRLDMPGQYVSTGIAEQNAIMVSAGLALSGKKVFAYAIAPFIVFRCLEQVRVNLAMMNLPVTIVGVGAGFGYEDAGPTHHLLEDIALMRSMPNMVTHGITDNIMAEAMADISVAMKSPNYIRLERHVMPNIYDENTDFTQGLSVLREGASYLVSTGSMVHTVLEVADKLNRQGLSVGVIDVYRIPLNTGLFLEKVKGAKRLISVEEHFLPGGLGSVLAEVLSDNGLGIPLNRLGLQADKGYCYKYGGRESLREYYGLDIVSLERSVAGFLKMD
jgi:transketolase